MTDIRLFRRVFKTSGGDFIVIEGIYVRASKDDDRWRLTHWRVFNQWQGRWSHPSGPNGWYKIHGNRKKDIGALKLLRAGEPFAEPWRSECPYREEDRANLKAALGLEFASTLTDDLKIMIANIEANPGSVDHDILIAADALGELPGWDYETALARLNRHEYFGYLIKGN